MLGGRQAGLAGWLADRSTGWWLGERALPLWTGSARQVQRRRAEVGTRLALHLGVAERSSQRTAGSRSPGLAALGSPRRPPPARQL